MAQKKSSILLVEDEAGFRRTYSDLFMHYGHDVYEADNGKDGLRLACDKKPDLIMLDLVMPQMDGFEVLTKLRSYDATKEIPVIIFSVLGEQNHIQKALGMGANDYIVKGAYSPAEILGKIGQYLAPTNVIGI